MCLRNLWGYSGVLCVLLAFGACSGNEEERIEPFGWVRISDEEAVATEELEYMFAGSAPVDSLALAVDDYSDMIGRVPDKSRQSAARCHFWKGRLRLRQGDAQGCADEIDSALALADSVCFPYDVRRFRWLTERPEDKSAGERYAFLRDELDFYGRSGCVLMQSTRNMDLGWMMLEAGYQNRALDYFLAADSLLRGTRLRTAYTGNRVNIADLTYASGDTAGALRIFHELRSLPEVKADEDLSTLADYNLYIIGGDTAALRRAWESLKGDTLRGGLRSLTAAHMAERMLCGGDTAKAAAYASEARRFLPMVTQGDHLAFIQKTLGRTAMATGKHDMSAAYYTAYAATTDSLLKDKHRGELIAAETSRLIAEAEATAARRKRAVELRFALIASLVSALAAAGIWYVIRRIRALRRRKEESERSELAMSLRIQEKDGVIDLVDKRLDCMVEAGILSANDISEIRSAIKSETATDGEGAGFARIFAQLSPEFASRLHAQYPGVKKASEKLACYIAIGMDTRHIARIMNIRPESVRQGRWRLKSQMGLGGGDNLDEKLRELLR